MVNKRGLVKSSILLLSKAVLKKLLFCSFLILLLTPVVAQQNHSLITEIPILKESAHIFDKKHIYFKQKAKAQGLPNYLSSIKKDKKGFLWIGSEEGIFRYDGIKFKAFKYDPADPEGLSHNWISAIYTGQSGNIWATTATDGVLYRFDAALEKFKKLPLLSATGDTLPPVEIRQLLEDSHGIVWLATAGYGLNRLDPTTGKLSHIDLSDFLTYDFKTVFTVMEDQNQNLWGIGWFPFCLYFEKENRIIERGTDISAFIGDPRVKTTLTNLQVSIKSLTEDERGYLWGAGFDKEIIRYEPKTRDIQKYTFDSKVWEEGYAEIGAQINDLLVGLDGKIWIGNNIGGITILNPDTKKFIYLRHNRFDPKSLSNDAVTDIFQEENGSIWITTWGGGLNYYQPNLGVFNHFRSLPTLEYTLTNPKVTSFCENEKGTIWIGTEDGLNQFDRNTGYSHQYFPPLAISNARQNQLFSIATNESTQSISKDNLWIGSQSGLLIFEPQTGTFSKWIAPNAETKPLETDYVSHLSNDKNGRLWAVSFKPYRIFHSDENTKRFKYPIIKDIQDSVLGLSNSLKIVADRQYHYWITTKQSKLFRLDLNTEELTPFHILPNSAEKFPADEVLCFWVDGQNRQWIGTHFGLYLLKPNINKANEYHFERYTENDGLPDNSILGILEDKQGFLWLSTKNGLSRLDANSMTFRNYSEADGLQSNHFSENAFLKDRSSGELYFGGSNGFNVFNPDSLQTDTIAPLIEITAVEIFRDSIMQPIIPEKSANIPVIELFHGDKILRIYFAALHFTAPKLNQYAVQLEGEEETWRAIGNESTVTYSNLDAGTYLFRVKASNKDGVWNEKGTSLKVIVHPPWWATWWAYTFYFVSLAMGLYFLYRFQLQRNLEKQEAANLKEMDQLKTRFFSNITHEFRTPLTLILGPAKQLHEEESKPKKQKKLARIVNNANNLMNLINQLLDLSKLESRQMNVEIKHGDIVEYTQKLIDTFKPLAKRKKQKLRFYSNQEIWETNFDQKKWNKIVLNLLSNAIKFTQKEGKIELRLTKLTNPEVIHLEVKDNGKGIEKENLGQIFNRFYQIDSSTTRHQEGTGIGLSLVKELVELQGGKIQVRSEIGKGTTFEIKIPVLQSQEKVGKLEQNSLNNIPISVEEKTIETIEQHSNSEELLEVLIIEDNAEMRDYICSCLDPTKYRFTMASDGEQGIEKAYETIPDLIISDVMMPKKDGFEVITAIREHLPTSHIPLVLLTAKAALESRLEGFERGADAYLTKPFSPDELVLRVQKLIELRQSLQKRYENPNVESDKETPIFQKEDAFITNLKAYIIDNIDKSELTVVDISAHFFMSRVQLYRKLKALTNESASTFIQKVRLEVALELIKNKELNISEIAYQTGFSSPSYFSTVFKKVYGKMPSEV